MQSNGQGEGVRRGSIEQGAGAWSQVQRVGQAHCAPAESSLLDALHWLVTIDHQNVVGPFSANQVAQGIRAGQVPREASIQAVGEVFWTGVLDEPAVLAALKSI